MIKYWTKKTGWLAMGSNSIDWPFATQDPAQLLPEATRRRAQLFYVHVFLLL
jgi:hypothetical protein